MHRDFRHLLPLALATTLFLVASPACGVGDARTGTGGEETGGGGGGGGGPDGGAGPGTDGGGTPADDCDEPVTAGLPSGNHNPGLSCIEAGCHAAGGGGPTWTIAGTIYDAPTGGQALPGATIRIIDAAGKEIELVSAQNGNFYTLEPVTYPLQGPVASSCPDTRQMPDPVQQGGGGCNQAGCHDANRRVSLP